MGNQPSTTARVGHLGVEPRPSCSQSRRATICTSARLSVRTAGFEPAIPWSPTRCDTRLRHVLIISDPCGSRTQPARLERPMTSPEVEWAVLCALTERRVGQEALESSSAVLQTAAIPSQLPARATTPDSCESLNTNVARLSEPSCNARQLFELEHHVPGVSRMHTCLPGKDSRAT